MPTVSPAQTSPGEEITADKINNPINTLADVVNGDLDDDNIASLSGTKIPAGTVPESALTSRASDYLADFIASGGVIAQSAGLTGTFSDIVFYVAGIRYTKTSIANKVYTASKDTYVDIGIDSTVDYNEVANGAASPALSANHVRVAKVVTDGSAITSVTQVGRSNTVQIYPDAPFRPYDWWEELARTTLTAAGDTITVSSIPKRRYLKILISCLDTGGTIRAGVRFNNDSGNNYAVEFSDNGAADSASTSQAQMQLDNSALASPLLIEAKVFNVATDEKVVSAYSSQADTAGAATAPNRRESTGKWANTTDAITRVDVINIGTGDYAIGSEVVVLGHD